MADDELPSIPGYIIEKKLGQGGMASVYLASQEKSGQQVALKIMSDTLGEDDVWIRRFIKEAQIIAQLSHPNIIPVFDVGTHESHFFISMETMDGGDLESKMAQGISIPEVLKVIVGVAAGLDFAGEKGFVHRDIKPDNVMFRDDGSPVILDFGIVKQKNATDDKMTKTGTVIGTSDYMSPEQIQGQELDERSDIYSLGCMMFELLAGRTPYQGESAMAVLLQHVNEPPPELPQSLQVFQPIISKAMAKKVNQRYARAQEMIEHLQDLTPDIKKLIAKQQSNANTADNSITKANTAISEEVATVVRKQAGAVHKKVSSTAITSDIEISDVLKDARATIHHFSAATLSKKVKRTRAFIILASVVAISALSYVAYQQLHVAPLEMARAEQAMADKSRKKIAALLTEASIIHKALNYSELVSTDKLVTAYREILRIDPDNSQAQSALNKLGASYIELAEKNLKAGNMDLAVTYRDYAERLSPGDQNLLALQNSIAAMRASSTQQQMESQFQQQQIERLLTSAAQEASASQGFSERAYNNLQQVLQMDEENSQAKTQIQSLLSSLHQAAKLDISKNRISAARTKTQQLDRYGHRKDQVSDLLRELKVAQDKISLQKKNAQLAINKNTLLSKAKRLQREARTIGVNEDLRDIFMTILSTDTKNTQALKGMNNVSSYDEGLARAAINERNYDSAQQRIIIIEQHTPHYSGLATLQSDFQLAKKMSVQADGIISEARRLLSSSSEGDTRRQELRQTYEKLEQAAKADEKNPQLAPLLAKLESTYATTIQQLITTEQKNLVTAYFDDVTGLNWPSDRLFQLKMANQNTAPAKKKSKRVLTGGF